MKIALLYSGVVGAAVKAYLESLKNGDELLCLEPKDYNETENTGARLCPKIISDFNPDWLILAWWPKIIHHSTIKAAKNTVNLHNSYLPWCKGKHPNFWAIVENTPYGVSLHEVSAYIDAGPIYTRKQIPVLWEYNGEMLHKLSLTEIIKLFEETWPRIRNNPQTYPNIKGTFHYAEEIEKARSIDLDEVTTARKLFNLIRAADAYGHTATFRDYTDTYRVKITIERTGNE